MAAAFQSPKIVNFYSLYKPIRTIPFFHSSTKRAKEVQSRRVKQNKTMMMNNRNLKKSTSMGFQNPPQAATYYPTKSPLIEFPTSPQLIFGQEILHFSHPQHPLSRINLPDLFTCSGCKEFGAGMRFTCQQCEFQLHEFCARAPDALSGHPFHSHHQLSFYSKPGK